MNRTEMLVKAIKEVMESKKTELSQLVFAGVNGGKNARDIKGWAHSPNGTISRSAKIAGLPTMGYWTGSLPTPATAIPECLVAEITAEYNKIFSK